MLGALDLDEFVDQHLVNLSDWERNFKALKARGRDAEKLPMEIKVSTFKHFRNICVVQSMNSFFAGSFKLRLFI